MILLSWRDNYRVGVRLIDTEHQYLFGLINEFHDQYASGSTHGQLLLALRRLVTYAEEHFQHEEALMQERGYPRLIQHQRMHEDLYSSIFALNEKLSQATAKVNAETLRFLKRWLVEHILREDMDIGDFLARKTAQAETSAQRTAGSPVAGPLAAKSAASEPAQDAQP